MVRGDTFDCGLPVVVVVDVVDVVDVLLAALLLLEGEPHPTKPMPTAVMAIATPLIAAIRFIDIVPCRSSCIAGPNCRRTQPEPRTLVSSAVGANVRVCADVLRWAGPHAG